VAKTAGESASSVSARVSGNLNDVNLKENCPHDLRLSEMRRLRDKCKEM
jgi:hypothetical protein